MKINKLIDFNKVANLAKIINSIYDFFAYVKRKKLETSCISLVLLVISQFGWNIYSSQEDPIIFKSSEYSLYGRLEELKKSHLYFTKTATDKEKLVRWIDLFYKSRYSKWRTYGDYDCSSALVSYLRSWGANISSKESVQTLKEKVERLVYLKQISLKKNYRDIQPWDIIIFKPNATGNYHVALIYDKSPDGQICYTDVNAWVDSMGFGVIKHGDARIDMIVNVSFAFWAGDLLNEDEFDK